MKHLCLFCLVSVLVAACGAGQKEPTPNTPITSAPSAYCFKATNNAPLASDSCFQLIAQLSIPSGTSYAWVKDTNGQVSALPNKVISGDCSRAGYVAALSINPLPTVCMMTNYGEIVLALQNVKAPITSANFLKYVNDGFYTNTIFHRVMANFMIQGGGFTYSATSGYSQKTPTYAPITLETTATTGLSNTAYTIAMARTGEPHSATSQFFINVVDNAFLNYSSSTNPGYAVFGSVISGTSTVNAIAAVAVQNNGAGEVSQPSKLVAINWAYQMQ